MSDDEFFTGVGESNAGTGRSTGLTRRSRVTAELDVVFDLLRIARRRYLLYYLHDLAEDVTDIEDAVDAVCAYEARGTERDGFPPREGVRIGLYHEQIPRLESAGIVDYDRRQGTIRFRGSASLEEWLEHARQLELD